ncbi:MAG TPA: hybrid sensor histidine kinase/response regulator, partial [Rhodanobacteraceae bacterium]
MKLQDNIDFTALNWVKHELDATLKQGRDALEQYVENPSDVALMRESALHLHQVQGTLRMVELYGAAMVVEEMERLAKALLDDTVKQRDEAYSVLMRGMVQLPDYLERVQSGHKDIPIVLLPLLNDLRACRGDNLLTESALFSPDLHTDLPAAAAGSPTSVAPADLHSQALRLRLQFQAALLKWFRDERATEHLDRLSNVLDRLRAISYGSEPRRLWWIAGGVIEAVRDGGLEPSVAVKLLFGGVDREIKRYAENGETGFAAQPPRDLVKNLLYYIAHSTGQGPRVREIRATYRLDHLLPTQKELQHAQGSMTGHNRNLLDTVSIAIKEDLLRVKESLDIFLRSTDANPADLSNQAEILDRVGDTLGMLGLGMPRKVVGEQRTVIEEMADHRRPIDEGALLDVAGALLYVEASLDDHIERLGAGGESTESSEGALELPKAEVRKILDALMREAAVNIQQAKHDIIAFIESPWEHARVEQIPRLLEEISGALRMLGLADAAELMKGIVRFVETELLRHRRVPTAEQMDKLADALAAIEYYLEATRAQRGNRERILNVTRESLEALGYWPVPSGGGGSGSAATP